MADGYHLALGMDDPFLCHIDQIFQRLLAKSYLVVKNDLAVVISLKYGLYGKQIRPPFFRYFKSPTVKM